MNILIAPNAFKGTMSAAEAGGIIAAFINENYPSYTTFLLPIADGGDGTCELLTEVLGLKKRWIWSLDVYGRPILCSYGWDDISEKAYLDISSASGIAQLGNEPKNPYVASSYGTGLLIQQVVRLGAKEVVVGLGGSATIDLGTGILAALGIAFLDAKGRQLTPYSPDYLSRIRHVQKSPTIPKVKFTCLCDVQNTFFGDKGAVPVFGPQKGLAPSDIYSYQRTCKTVAKQLFQKQGKAFHDYPGFGAAGGVALGLSAFFEVDIEFGSNYFFDKVNLKTKLKEIDWVITGEGRYDSQSSDGKACYELLKLTHKYSKKITLITSGKEGGAEQFDKVLTLPDLDFAVPDFKKKARQNLLQLLSSELDFSIE
ncbi:glycerate kinase [Algoriphagus sp. AGSA1]|uniref:glycerate kinase n=1 Tax=Algoriphagus sp. AGSA1 TaxID=2907213 RepID=UPI001F1E02A2|nr:glycerate kinase [Algoriphagus sp. AGSA1]MCE7056127.1 glycerate kinase [Algoriphagus sp. AGSA1]